MYLENQSMDVIKTSLIIGIGLTLYYLLLQWPTDNDTYDSSFQEHSEINTFSDSSGIGLGNGYTFTSDYDCSSNVTSNSLNGGIITNQACINEIIKSGSNTTGALFAVTVEFDPSGLYLN